MKVASYRFENEHWVPKIEGNIRKPQLVLFFASKVAMVNPEVFDQLRALFPDSIVAGCSTAGEILEDKVLDDSAVATAFEFETTSVKLTYRDIEVPSQSFETGNLLASSIPHDELRAVFVLSDGQIVNGSELVRGLAEKFPPSVVVTGGLAGDGDSFKETLVSANTQPEKGRVALIAFYGKQFQIGYGHAGGWESFGQYRLISKSKANVLYELDHQPALELYKKYLGDEAANLPGSALLFPLMVKPSTSSEEGIVRTILSIDEVENTMTFAGDVPEGYVAKLMVTNFDKLVGGARQAAEQTRDRTFMKKEQPKIAILTSCVGRKLLLGTQITDEVIATKSAFDEVTHLIGFYSYGEISPNEKNGYCELHNQTMTVTLISESSVC